MENKYINESENAMPVLRALGYHMSDDKTELIKNDNVYNLSEMDNNYGYTISPNYLRYENDLEVVYLEFMKYGDSLKFNKLRINELEYSKDKSKKIERKLFTFERINDDDIKIVDKKRKYEASFGHDYISLFDANSDYSLGFFYSSFVDPKYSNIDTVEEKEGFINMFSKLCEDYEDLMDYIIGEIDEVAFNYSFVSQMQFEEKVKSK